MMPIRMFRARVGPHSSSVVALSASTASRRLRLPSRMKSALPNQPNVLMNGGYHARKATTRVVPGAATPAGRSKTCILWKEADLNLWWQAALTAHLVSIHKNLVRDCEVF
jgi:hypothetical protein